MTQENFCLQNPKLWNIHFLYNVSLSFYSVRLYNSCKNPTTFRLQNNMHNTTMVMFMHDHSLLVTHTTENTSLQKVNFVTSARQNIQNENYYCGNSTPHIHILCTTHCSHKMCITDLWLSKCQLFAMVTALFTISQLGGGKLSVMCNVKRLICGIM
jgi:hypothetical protein